MRHGQLSIQLRAMLAMALDGLGIAITRASQTFLVEQALCRHFYQTRDPTVIGSDGSVPEAKCKLETLQSQVALFTGSLDFFVLIISFLASPIYTRLASVVGKKNVLVLNTTSFALRMLWYGAVFYFHNFFQDIRWVLLVGLADLIGGGISVREILLYLYIAENVAEDKMTGTFNLLSAILIGMMSLGTFIGARLIMVNVYISCGLVITVYILLVLLVSLFFHQDSSNTESYGIETSSEDESSSLMSADSTALPLPLTPTSESRDDRQLMTKSQTQTVFQALLRAATVDLYLSVELVVQTVRHPFTRRIMMVYFGSTLAAVVSVTSPQWASGTFHSRISSVDQVSAMEQVISALTLLALPLFSKNVLRPRFGSKAAVDFLIILASLLAILAGMLIIAISPTLAFYAMGVTVSATGVGLADALRSFATSGLAEKKAVERLYVSIRTVQTVSAIIGTPMWTGIFLWILKHPDLPRGILYLADAGILVICLVLIRGLKRPLRQ